LTSHRFPLVLAMEVTARRRQVEEIIDVIVSVEDLKLRSFGSFHVRSKNERPGRNSKTGIAATVSARRVVTFTHSDLLCARSRVIAQIVGIHDVKTTAATTVYDPTCGSGSLLLKVGDEAGGAKKPTLNGQEKDAATAGLARMNMILHNNPQAVIVQGNTLTDPKFKEGDTLKTFDYVIANPPFSDKRWSTGLDPLNDPYDRFQPFGTPPAKQGDYAYLLHIVRSLKSTGKGACILPHGVLFRGNVEADIRRALVRRGYIKGIIGLPANLFYGTSIPACIVAVDKEDAHARKGIFMIDASGGFMKDGPKNRLRAQDIHKIVDVFTEAGRWSNTRIRAFIDRSSMRD